MIASVLLAAALGAAAPDDLASQLKAKDQRLLDAIAPGDRSTWDRMLAPDAVYIDENGVVMDRVAFLKQLTPLPPGASGGLKITKYSLRRVGDAALVIHEDDEREDFHGVALRAGYLTSETWFRIGGEWRLAMVHVYVVAEDPPALTVPAEALDAYVGRYAAGKDLTFVIRREGDHLLAGSPGGRLHPLRVEATDLLFEPGKPRVKMLFRRDSSGRVSGFIKRREGEDIVWTLQVRD